MKRIAMCALLLASAQAAAFVRSTTDRGVPIFWAGNCAFIIPDNQAPPELTLDAVTQTIDRSIAGWQSVTLDRGCTYLMLGQEAPQAVEARYDRKNVIKFRTDRWCRPADRNTPEMCYSRAAAAITTVFYSTDERQAGKILDADIEFNSVYFTFANLPSTQVPRQNTTRADLENTLTHELGHFMGLDHTCWDGATNTPPLDDTGNPVPSCSNLGSLPLDVQRRIIEATMYNFAPADETSKRTPEQDDIRAICSIYPAAQNPGQCLRPDLPKGGCSVGGGRTSHGMLALLFAAVLGLTWRRRRALGTG